MMTTDELNGVSQILSVSLGQLSKVVMRLFYPEGIVKMVTSYDYRIVALQYMYINIFVA